MISTYVFDVNSLENLGLFQKMYSLMPQYRQDKIDKTRFDKDKRLALGAGILLSVIAKRNGIPENAKVSFGENGKPFFRDFPKFCYNLSHSGNYVVGAFGSSQVGIDVEGNRKERINVAKRFFTDNEYKWILEGNEEKEISDRFFRIWALKESLIKESGKGMAQPLNAFEFTLENEEVRMKILATEENANIEQKQSRQLHFREYKIENYRVAVCSKEANISEKLEEVYL